MKSAPFRPRSVPHATFGMFGASDPVTLPAVASAQEIRNSSIRDIFKRLSKSSLAARKEAFEELIRSIPTVTDKEDLTLLARPCCAVLDSSVSDFHADTRKKAVLMTKALLEQLQSQKLLGAFVTQIFPPLLILSCDTISEVASAAKDLFCQYFTTSDKRNLLMTKIKREISQRIRKSFNELKKPDWTNLSEADRHENWGRICHACLVLSNNLLLVCQNLSSEIYPILGDFPLKQWLKPKDNNFSPRATPAMRSAAYIFLSITYQLKFMPFTDPNEIVEYILAESSPNAQEKLIKLVLAMIEKGMMDPKIVREPILEAIPFYYNAEEVGLGKLVQKIADGPEYIQKCILVAAKLPDTKTGIQLFNTFLNVATDDLTLTRQFLIEQLTLAVSPNPPSQFYKEFPLDCFISIAKDPAVEQILHNGNEIRSFQLLSKLNDDQSISWVKNKELISPDTLLKMILSQGTVEIRKIWPTFGEIPLQDTNPQSLASFIQEYARTEELPGIIKSHPHVVPYLLLQWTGNFSIFKCNELLEQVDQLLEQDISLIRFLIKIFPDDQNIIDMVVEKIRTRLLKNNQFDPDIFVYFNPPGSLLDDIIFSPALEILEPTDKIVPMIIRRIPQIVDKFSPVELAKASAQLVNICELDPIEISVSPIDSPAFCMEFWTIIGFEKMNPIDFCFLLNCYLENKQPWLHVNLYTQTADWKILPTKLWPFVKSQPKYAVVAQQQNLLYALACINSACQLNFKAFSPINGIVLESLSSFKPPKEAGTDKLANVIHCEWNQSVPQVPTISSTPDFMQLRQAVAYLQHALPLIEDIENYVSLVEAAIDFDDRFTFFLSLRILSLLYDIGKPFNVLNILNSIISKVINFYPIPPNVEKELIYAFKIGQYLPIDQFVPFVISHAQDFSTVASETLSKAFVQLISFFDQWDLVENQFNHKLDFSNVQTWYLITTSLLTMPYSKRADFVDQYTKLLPDLFDQLDPNSNEFITLISSFPSAAMKWGIYLNNAKKSVVLHAMEFGGTDKVFKNIAKSVTRLELQSTMITTDARNRTIHVVYVEDDASVPLKLGLSFGKNYPFCQVKVSAGFGNDGDKCGLEVSGAIVKNQSIEAGIIQWHKFVTYRLVDADPCTICYSYLNDEMKEPTVPCPTCGQKFHRKCISKWFSQCLRPTCPYCGKPWDEKKKKKADSS